MRNTDIQQVTRDCKSIPTQSAGKVCLRLGKPLLINRQTPFFLNNSFLMHATNRFSGHSSPRNLQFLLDLRALPLRPRFLKARCSHPILVDEIKKLPNSTAPPPATLTRPATEPSRQSIQRSRVHTRKCIEETPHAERLIFCRTVPFWSPAKYNRRS